MELYIKLLIKWKKIYNNMKNKQVIKKYMNIYNYNLEHEEKKNKLAEINRRVKRALIRGYRDGSLHKAVD